MSWYRSYVRDRDGGSLYALGEAAADVGSPPSPRRPGAPVARLQATSSSSRGSISPTAKQISTSSGASSSNARDAAACPLLLPRPAPPRVCSPAPPAPPASAQPALTAEIQAAAPAAEDQAAAAAAAAPQARPPEIQAAGSGNSGLQQQMQPQQRSAAPDSSTRPLFPDPLLHWVDCWAGPGLVRRAKRAAAAAGAAVSSAGGGKARSPAATSRPWHQDQQPPDELRRPLLQPEPLAPVAAQQLQLPQGPLATSAGPSSTKECAATPVVRSGRLLQSSPSNTSLASVGGSSCCDIPCSPRAQRPQLQRRPPQQQQQQRCVQLQPAGRSKAQHTAAPAAPGAGVPASQALPPPPPPPPQQPALRWWLLGGVALAGVSAGAVAATYAVFAYLLKASLVSSLAWKAATGVAAAEGMALGGWSCSSVRAGKASAAQSAAELARVTAQAEREVAALRSLLQQKQAEHSLEVSSLAALNEKLSLLAGQSLEAVAALQATQAGSAALLESSGAQQELLLQEVTQLSRGQAQLLALLCDVREDVMGLVSTSEQQFSGSDLAAAVASAGSASAGGMQGWQAGRSRSAALAGAGGTTGHDALPGEGEEEQVAFARSRSEPGPAGMPLLSGSSSGSSSGSLEADAQAGQSHQGLPAVPEALGVGEDGLGEWPLQLRRLGSVKGKVAAALAATVSDTLQL